MTDKIIFNIWFDTIHAVTGPVVAEKTAIEAGNARLADFAVWRIGEAIWMWAIEVFIAARVTLYKFVGL